MLGSLALAVAAFYAGAARDVCAGEQPAVLTLDDRAMLAAWTVALKRGALIQAPLCVIGFLLGAGAWLQTHELGDAIGALAMLANIPWTLAVMAPTNKALGAIAPEAAGPRSRALITRWYALHSLRTALGLLAIIGFLQAIMAR